MMHPDELQAMMMSLFGKRWQAQLAKVVDVNVTTVNRWARGKQPIPRWVQVLAWSLTMNKQHGVVLPNRFAMGLRSLVEGQSDVLATTPAKNRGKASLP